MEQNQVHEVHLKRCSAQVLGAQALPIGADLCGWDHPYRGVPRCPQPEAEPWVSWPMGQPCCGISSSFAFLVLWHQLSETSVGTGVPGAVHGITEVGEHRAGLTLSWLKALKWTLGGKVLRKGKQNITSSSMRYNKHRAAQRFWELNQNTYSSYTFLVGFQSFCEWFILMPIGKLHVCEGIDN